jgi:hypothetical protein
MIRCPQHAVVREIDPYPSIPLFSGAKISSSWRGSSTTRAHSISVITAFTIISVRCSEICQVKCLGGVYLVLPTIPSRDPSPFLVSS